MIEWIMSDMERDIEEYACESSTWSVDNWLKYYGTVMTLGMHKEQIWLLLDRMLECHECWIW